MSAEPVKKILVVDDEPDVLAYLGAVLRDNGFTVLTAANGKDGFDKAKSERPDLITLDITIPEDRPRDTSRSQSIPRSWWRKSGSC